MFKYNENIENIGVEYWLLTPTEPYYIVKQINSEIHLVKDSIEELEYTIKKIYNLKTFKKSKFNSSFKCNFCQYNTNFDLCDEETNQQIL